MYSLSAQNSVLQSLAERLRNWMNPLVLPTLRFKDTRICVWNVRDLCGTGAWKSLITEVTKCNLHTVAIQKFMFPEDVYPQEGY
jgi:hypothetical protein